MKINFDFSELCVLSEVVDYHLCTMWEAMNEPDSPDKVDWFDDYKILCDISAKLFVALEQDVDVSDAASDSDDEIPPEALPDFCR